MINKYQYFRNLINNQKPSLFLDRDGVINQRIVDQYVLNVNDFQWIEGVKESLRLFSSIFDPIVVITNQQGIAKGLMTGDDLKKIHSKMMMDIKESGGRIDKIYYCPDLKGTNSFFRKPQPGMGLKAKKDFPSIHFKKSVMVGDTLSDMQFGKKLNMITVLISRDISLARKAAHLVDYRFDLLMHFADYVKDIKN
ncbi:MAG: D-glycero-alpha-D-manno-heptose-1,7-bisphosphate 7-phosphatase [Bacteroidota bacterium]